MRQLLLLGVLLVISSLAGCGSAASGDESTEGTTVSFQVEGMMCAESCAKTVEEILAAQPGVRDVAVHFEDKQAVCEIDPAEFDADEALAELADQDFTATVEK